MSAGCLPFEVLVGLFHYLGVSDLLSVSQVSRLWREAASYLIADRVTIMITDDVSPAVDTFLASSVPYHNWVFKEVDLSMKGRLSDLWSKVSDQVKTLKLLSADLVERDFISLLQQCTQLEELRFDGLAHILMTGTLLSNPEDRKLLSASLKNVTRLHLACSRYLTDLLFTRITSVLGPLKKLSLAGCQISFQSAIHKRFYPSDGRVKVSDHVLTFKHILEYIEENAKTLKELSFGRTTIDSESLYHLSKIPGLEIESLHLMSCDQLSKSGVDLLCQNQKSILDLDLSLCSRMTDLAVLSVCQHLTHIKKLNLRRCQGITENGIRALRQLKHLEELNISHLDAVTSESVEEALGKEPHPSLKLLNVASLPLSWKTVVNIAASLPNLTFLDVSMCTGGINDKSVQAICKSLTKLQTLNLSGCTAVTDIGLAGHGLGQQEPVPDMTGTGLSLENLGVRNKDPFKVPLGSKAEQMIRKEAEVKKYLKENLEQIVNSTEYGLGNLQGLRELNLCGCIKVTDITLTHALHLQELQYLNLSHCQAVGEEGLINIANQCPSLEVLMLVDCGQTTDQVILVLSHHLKRIKTLDLQRCFKLTDDALDSLSNCTTLQYLDVSGCEKMSLEQVRLVQERIPRLHNLHHRGVKEKNPPDEDPKDWPSQSGKIPPPPPLLSKLKKKVIRR
ncbi:dynein regulatory complex subunit 6-like isoform X1 [Penaeus chinensis]|uniref:dynein regulatory complex subunit 6-like isoform X1 n=1 Tax=Penaeus chinensis TaxID=139456 RepID=UPI001FB5CEFE|nr:dynein regulatory complex subunit 6-like isoform X1 [Penaeus chinensis]